MNYTIIPNIACQELLTLKCLHKMNVMIVRIRSTTPCVFSAMLVRTDLASGGGPVRIQPGPSGFPEVGMRPRQRQDGHQCDRGARHAPERGAGNGNAKLAPGAERTKPCRFFSVQPQVANSKDMR